MRTRSPLLFSAAAAVAAALPTPADAQATQAAGPARPNIVFILADDLGWGDPACYGHPYARTPALDALARGGAKFGQFYAVAPWCAPSRYGFMTGKLPARTFEGQRRLRPEEPTVTQTLADAGYAVAHLGKWHMSGIDRDGAPPEAFGVDLNRAFLSSNDGLTQEMRDAHAPFRPHSTDFYVDEAIDFIDEQHAAGRPFYVNLWIAPTHSVIDPTPEQLAPFEGLTVDLADFPAASTHRYLQFIRETAGDLDANMRAYLADVLAMDRAIGRLVDTLEDRGLRGDTLIVFSSDNGPGLIGAEEEMAERIEATPKLANNVGSSGPFRLRKLSLHDGGVRVPLIVNWPGHVQPGTVNDTAVFGGADFFPSICQLLDLPVPDGLDGQPLAGTFLGRDPAGRTEPIYFRQGRRCAARAGDFKAYLDADDTLEIYHLPTDPGEQNDVTTDRPEDAARLRALLTSWRAEMPDVIDAEE